MTQENQDYDKKIIEAWNKYQEEHGYNWKEINEKVEETSRKRLEELNETGKTTWEWNIPIPVLVVKILEVISEEKYEYMLEKRSFMENDIVTYHEDRSTNIPPEEMFIVQGGEYPKAYIGGYWIYKFDKPIPDAVNRRLWRMASCIREEEPVPQGWIDANLQNKMQNKMQKDEDMDMTHEYELYTSLEEIMKDIGKVYAPDTDKASQELDRIYLKLQETIKQGKYIQDGTV